MRITEQSNPLTATIDQASPAEIVRLIGKAEGQSFGDEQWGQGLLDPIVLEQVGGLRTQIKQVLAHPQGTVVFSGAGTSGRLAVHADVLSGHPRVHGLMAGGMDAFFSAKEGVEDSPEAGARDLASVLPEDAPFVYVGITCGLSAAYVAGQLDLTLKRGGVAAVIGFNPLEDALTRALPGLDVHFKALLERMPAQGGFLLNPILGPEPITGSTRMKGGTVTRLLLDILLSNPSPKTWVGHAKQVHRLTFAAMARGTAYLRAMEEAGTRLSRGDGFAYLADGRAGLSAVLDASECPPTFGAGFDQVRVFVDDAFEHLLPGFQMQGFRAQDGRAYKAQGGLSFTVGFAVGMDLTPPSMVQHFLSGVDVTLRPGLLDLSLKWMLNTLSTGAFILAGKVLGNRMIDLRISNLKLWDRARRIISDFGRCEAAEAERLMIAALGLKDPLPLPEMVARASKATKLVTVCVLAARLNLSLSEARNRLETHPRLYEHQSDWSIP